MTPTPDPGFRPSALTAALAVVAIGVMAVSYLAGVLFA